MKKRLLLLIALTALLLSLCLLSACGGSGEETPTPDREHIQAMRQLKSAEAEELFAPYRGDTVCEGYLAACLHTIGLAETVEDMDGAIATASGHVSLYLAMREHSQNEHLPALRERQREEINGRFALWLSENEPLYDDEGLREAEQKRADAVLSLEAAITEAQMLAVTGRLFDEALPAIATRSDKLLLAYYAIPREATGELSYSASADKAGAALKAVGASVVSFVSSVDGISLSDADRDGYITVCDLLLREGAEELTSVKLLRSCRREVGSADSVDLIALLYADECRYRQLTAAYLAAEPLCQRIAAIGEIRLNSSYIEEIATDCAAWAEEYAIPKDNVPYTGFYLLQAAKIKTALATYRQLLSSARADAAAIGESLAAIGEIRYSAGATDSDAAITALEDSLSDWQDTYGAEFAAEYVGETVIADVAALRATYAALVAEMDAIRDRLTAFPAIPAMTVEEDGELNAITAMLEGFSGKNGGDITALGEALTEKYAAALIRIEELFFDRERAVQTARLDEQIAAYSPYASKDSTLIGCYDRIASSLKNGKDTLNEMKYDFSLSRGENLARLAPVADGALTEARTLFESEYLYFWEFVDVRVECARIYNVVNELSLGATVSQQARDLYNDRVSPRLTAMESKTFFAEMTVAEYRGLLDGVYNDYLAGLSALGISGIDVAPQ